MRVAGRAGMEIRELGGHGLADDDRAGGAQLRNDRGVVAWPAAGTNRRAELGRIIRGVDDVLDRDRNTVQRPDRAAFRAALVECARLRKHAVAIDMDERPDLAVDRLDAIETG